MRLLPILPALLLALLPAPALASALRMDSHGPRIEICAARPAAAVHVPDQGSAASEAAAKPRMQRVDSPQPLFSTPHRAADRSRDGPSFR